jgi:hypothetical protein
MAAEALAVIDPDINRRQFCEPGDQRKPEPFGDSGWVLWVLCIRGPGCDRGRLKKAFRFESSPETIASKMFQ